MFKTNIDLLIQLIFSVDCYVHSDVFQTHCHHFVRFCFLNYSPTSWGASLKLWLSIVFIMQCCYVAMKPLLNRFISKWPSKSTWCTVLVALQIQTPNSFFAHHALLPRKTLEESHVCKAGHPYLRAAVRFYFQLGKLYLFSHDFVWHLSSLLRAQFHQFLLCLVRSLHFKE